jgi:hypothetical protein
MAELLLSQPPMPRMPLVVALAIVTAVLLAPRDAKATDCGSGEGCALAAYAIVTGGGLATSGAIQVKLMRGEPIEDGWRAAGGTLAGLNMLAGAGFFLAAALVDDDDAAIALGVLGGLNTAIAASNGFTLLVAETAGEDPPPGDIALPEGDLEVAADPLRFAGASFGFRF